MMDQFFINPITGPTSRFIEGVSMTDKEKESDLEAEKLFILFDRSEKTGAISPEQNPQALRKAIQQRRN